MHHGTVPRNLTPAAFSLATFPHSEKALKDQASKHALAFAAARPIYEAAIKSLSSS